MEEAITFNPEIGEIVAAASGLRKMRFGYGRSGKRGGGRTIYYVFGEEAIFMIAACAKVDKSDLTSEEMCLFKSLIEELKR
ncbi:MAG: type II toxin-antitoxin system RelE/ParE family toxin [Caulobacteraceae bacterium]